MPVSWAYGLMGGMMIGVAGALFLLMNGRIMGMSGILGALVDGTGRDNRGERLAFVAGVVGVPAGLALLFGGATHLTENWGVIVVAGLVGLGTRVGSGCTSGHGVCGISRLSLRGIVATAIYVLAGVATMALLRHGLGII
jgi:uncharacterized membrane protein YedE/YeeE